MKLELEESGMDSMFTSNNPNDRRAKQMAKQALEFAMKNGLTFTYQNNVYGLNFYFPKKGIVSRHMTYLNWENREELFTKMMAEAKELI